MEEICEWEKPWFLPPELPVWPVQPALPVGHNHLDIFRPVRLCRNQQAAMDWLRSKPANVDMSFNPMPVP